ncbi:MAG: BTB/POZ domain-containing protein KCTD2 [Desulfovibrio sp.]|jgi:hypothetical protein|nr:BTB/POZ domain-containing protein KCTD2 [Desulfovibrio sp.]
MKKIFLSSLLSVFAASSAYAACTQEEAQQKAMAVSTQIQALAQKDAKRFQEVITEFQKKSQELANIQDLDAVCKYYDEMLEKTK